MVWPNDLDQGGATVGTVVEQHGKTLGGTNALVTAVVTEGGGGGGGGAVSSVFGRVGAVVSANNDYAFSQISGTALGSQVATFSSSVSGVVPSSGGGTTNFLRADGTWAAPPGGGGGTPGGSSGQIQYNNASAFGGAGIWRNSANLITHSNGVNAQALYVYNTTDTDGGTPTNYERGTFDWTTTANTLTIGTIAGGTGSNRTVVLQAGASNTFTIVPGAGIAANFSTSFAFQAGATVADVNNTGAMRFYPSGDISVGRNAAHVLGIGDGGGPNANGWYQWAGQARVTSDVTFTSTTVLGTVTGLSVSVQAGRTYTFEAQLQVTDAAAGGVQAAIAGTATATAIQYTGWTVADNAIKGKTNATALGTAVGSTTTTETTGIVVQIYGTITVNAAGTLLVQAAQNTSNGTATTVKRGSYFYIYDIP